MGGSSGPVHPDNIYRVRRQSCAKVNPSFLPFMAWTYLSSAQVEEGTKTSIYCIIGVVNLNDVNNFIADACGISDLANHSFLLTSTSDPLPSGF